MLGMRRRGTRGIDVEWLQIKKKVTEIVKTGPSIIVPIWLWSKIWSLDYVSGFEILSYFAPYVDKKNSTESQRPTHALIWNKLRRKAT